MGQGASQPQRGQHDRQRESAAGGGSEMRQRRRLSSLGNLMRNADTRVNSSEDAGELLSSQRQPHPPARSLSTNRLSRILHSSTTSPLPSDAGPSRPSALQRSRTTLSNMFRPGREDRSSRNGPSRPQGILQQRSSYIRTSPASDEQDEYHPPRLPSIDQTSNFDHEMFGHSYENEVPPRSSGSNRLQNIRFNSLRPDRPFRNITSSLRRRRSPPPASLRRSTGGDDQAAMLSRLLSVAAAATAATLMGDDHQALSEARSLTGGTGIGDVGDSGEDGSFDGFLRELQNGRLASALRQGGDEQNINGEATQTGSLNMFRMFRFGSSNMDDQRRMSQSQGSDSQHAISDRMVPIIIVGIRSINPNSNTGSGSAVDDLPPFIDALGQFPSPLPAHALGTHGHDSIDSILRPPQNGTSFRHRRRASMGGLMGRSRINDRYDDQRDHRSPDRRRERPWSVSSSSSAIEAGHRPPPATPASPSPELSRISSRNTTPSHSRPASFIANSARDFATDLRRNSALHRSATNPLSSHTEETLSLHSARSSDNLLSQAREHDHFRGHRRSDTAPNIHYPRFASGHPRRNGVVEPDHLPSLSRSSTSNATDTGSVRNAEGRNSNSDSRSWIIYVLGGSYPENHPILTTPSLFTENPTYEDMMLLSALLGPAKPPVASEEDVQSAGGVYDIVLLHESSETNAFDDDAAKTAELIAIATEGTVSESEPNSVPLDAEQRCLVCQCEYEPKEVARRLAKCGHLYHKECIDTWLTQGRNSCPLCRGQGVDETQKEAPASLDTESIEDQAAHGALADDIAA